MANDGAALVQKFWNFYNVLRDDVVSYSDYVEQFNLSAVPENGG